MSQVELFTQVIPASGQIVVAPGNYFLMTTATGSVNIRIQKPSGYSEGCNGVSAGLLLQRVEIWQQLTIVGAAGVSVTFFTGNITAREDITTIQSQIAVLGGISAISEAPSTTIASPANLNVLTVSAQTVAANLLRRRITVGSLAANTGNVYLQAVGAGAGRGIELQPGQFVEMMTTAAFDIRNDTAGTQVITLFEES